MFIDNTRLIAVAPSCSVWGSSAWPARPRPGPSTWPPSARRRQRSAHPTTRLVLHLPVRRQRQRQHGDPYDTSGHADYAVRGALALARGTLDATTPMSPALANGRRVRAGAVAGAAQALFDSKKLAVQQRGAADPADHAGRVSGPLGTAAAKAVLAQRPAVGLAKLAGRRLVRGAGAAHWATWRCPPTATRCSAACRSRAMRCSWPARPRWPTRSVPAGRWCRRSTARSEEPVRLLPSAATRAQPDPHRPARRCWRSEYNRITARAIDSQGALNECHCGQRHQVRRTAAGQRERRRRPLNQQLEMVARLIDARGALGMKRQVFMVSLGGLSTRQPGHAAVLMDQVARAMAGFQAAMDQIGINANVTNFTASDFGRTMTSNGDGSDHGWGQHPFRDGQRREGQRPHGTPPQVALGGPEDTGQGRLLPPRRWRSTRPRWLRGSACRRRNCRR